MDEVLGYLGAHLSAEWAVITGAPIISLATAAVLGVALYVLLWR
jgi:hypothetical protein